MSVEAVMFSKRMLCGRSCLCLPSRSFYNPECNLYLKLVSNADYPQRGRAAIKISTSVPVLETIFSIVAKSLNDAAQISRSLCLYFQLFKLEIFHITIQQCYLTQMILFTCHGLLCTPSLQLNYSYKLVVKQFLDSVITSIQLFYIIK